MALTVECPTCKKRVETGNADFPFCSERCRLIDLGRWANEEYRIPVVGPAPVELGPLTPGEEEE
jgi:endogenous inhibitor of DNA gyrase (YacG/DUF329 family)